MIGNDNGQFKWGQSAFGMSSRNITVTQDGATQANYLNGELLDLFGNWQKSRINLDEKLTINEYVDQGTGETYHRLMINKSTLNKADKRKLVLCFDGTAGKFSGTQNTNVVKLVELLKKDDPSQQMIYYQVYL
ncbi:unnamed protein product [Rhizoctonia solani]|nr:unnamed protein product [Rhizoctonia solani]